MDAQLAELDDWSQHELARLTKLQSLSPQRRRDANVRHAADRHLSGQIARRCAYGMALVHNRLRLTRRLGSRGSRPGLQQPNNQALEPCPCGWAPGLGTHSSDANQTPVMTSHTSVVRRLVQAGARSALERPCGRVCSPRALHSRPRRRSARMPAAGVNRRVARGAQGLPSIPTANPNSVVITNAILKVVRAICAISGRIFDRHLEIQH
jgi:hypothetical protein